MTHFQNVDQFSKCWHIFKILSSFQNVYPFSKCWPLFKVFIHLQPLYHHFISVCRWTWGDTTLWWPATLSWHSHFHFSICTLTHTEKKIGGQIIQISVGKSALWWEQKRQMSRGKSDKLSGGKSDKGKWTTTWKPRKVI